MSEVVHRKRALIATAMLATLAAADGVYLTLVHLDYETGHLGLAAVCHALSEAGCSVTGGRFGAVAGIPIATIGFAGAIATLGLAGAAFVRRDRWDDPHRSTLLVLAVLGVLASVLMATFSVLEASFCPFCVAWYGLNLGLLATTWVARNRGHATADIADDALGRSGFVALIVFCLALVGAVLLSSQRRTTLLAEREAYEAKMLAEHGGELAAEIVAELKHQPAIELDLPTAPSKGPVDAEVTLVEFADFECPHCRGLWDEVGQYLEKTPRRVRVVFAHYPLDASCNPYVDLKHPHACDAAVASMCAQREGEFWAYGQLLFANQTNLERDDLIRYAEQAGLDVAAFGSCLDDVQSRDQVVANVELGERLGIVATPTLYINGYAHKGSLPAPLLALVIDQLLATGERAAP